MSRASIIATGLLLDLIGALVLVIFQFKTKSHVDDDLIVADHGGGWFTQKKHIRQRKYSVTGFTILVLGFTLQTIGSNAMLYNLVSKLNDPYILGLLVSAVGTFHISAAVFWMRYKNFRRTFHGDNKGMSQDSTDLFYKQSRKTLLGFIVFLAGILFQIIDYFLPAAIIPTIVALLILLSAIILPPISGLFLFNDNRMKKLEEKAVSEEIAEEAAKKVTSGQ